MNYFYQGVGPQGIAKLNYFSKLAEQLNIHSEPGLSVHSQQSISRIEISVNRLISFNGPLDLTAQFKLLNEVQWNWVLNQ